MKSSRHSRLSSWASLSRLSGEPPRSHRRCQLVMGTTSVCRKGVSSTSAMGPARLSWLCRSNGPESEPSGRKRPGLQVQQHRIAAFAKKLPGKGGFAALAGAQHQGGRRPNEGLRQSDTSRSREMTMHFCKLLRVR
jgi:hypothetical protein